MNDWAITNERGGSPEFDRRVYAREYRGLLGCSDPWFRELQRRGKISPPRRDVGGRRTWWFASEVRADMARMAVESEPAAA